MTPIADALAFITARLKSASIEEPRREARLILAAAHATDSAGLLARTHVDETLYAPLLTRRVHREPLAYITGRKEFWGLMFAVSPATLIPRPDSETLIQAALTLPAPATVLDLGTGTGCLLLSLLHERPHALGLGIDISPDALALAARNAAALGLQARAAFAAGDWFAPVNAKFDLILSNPPYIPASTLRDLMPEVANYEPASALAGGADGLNAYRVIIAALPQYLKQNGAAVLELGAGQAQSVASLANHAGLTCATTADLAGIPRAATLTLPK